MSCFFAKSDPKGFANTAKLGISNIGVRKSGLLIYYTSWRIAWEWR